MSKKTHHKNLRSIFVFMDLSVIIVSYNVKYFLEHCLLSVQKACREIDAEVLLIDNASSDGSKEYLEQKFPQVRFFWNNENNGFAKANNEMLAKATGDHILFLNPDTIVPEDSFINCIEFFRQHSDCGALGVKMIDGSGEFLQESKRTLPNAKTGFYKMSGLAGLFPNSKKMAGYYANDIGQNENGKVDILAGAFMMLHKDAAVQTKGFDENFFMYGEDIDLSYRIIKAGFKNYYSGETTIIHFKGESTNKNSKEHIRNFYGAMKMFADKHYKKNLPRDIAIGFGKNIALLKAKFYWGSKSKERNKKILIKGDTTEKINRSLAENNYQIVSGDRENATSILFCEGSVSNKKIIELLQGIPPNTNAFFHESGAGSLIGSNDKNSRGLVIAMK